MFVRTERLLLRPGWVEDAPRLHAALADEAVVRNLARVPWPYTVDDAAWWLAQADGPLPHVLILDDTGELVGGAGLAKGEAGRSEVGYWIARRFWNRGYATEAAEAMIRAADHGYRLAEVEATPFADNPASGRVLAKLGFAATGERRALKSPARAEAAESVVYRRARVG